MQPLKPLTFTDADVLNRSVVVSASAGSGKTFTLTVMVLLALGRMEARPYEIFATTFSEAAAADLRERLLRPLDLLASFDLDAWAGLLPIGADFPDLLSELDISPGLSKSAAELIEAAPHFDPQPWMDTPLAAQSFWRRTRREAELTHVSTLHGLALGLLRMGRGAPDRILEADHPALLRVLRQALRETAREIADVPKERPDSEAADALLKWAEGQWKNISPGHDAHRDAMGHNITELSEELCLELNNALEMAQNALRPFAANPELAKDSSSGSRRYFDPKKILPPPGPKSPLSEQIRWAERQSLALDSPIDSLPGYYTAGFIEALQPLTALSSAWEACLRAVLAKGLEKFESLKQSRNMATFGDIVRAALEGLKDGSIDPPRPKLLLVDEYQDTSRAQDAFLEALRAERIIRVGDVKQSIYGFRGGSPDILLGHIEAANDYAYRLTANYRSAPPIVDLANVFVKEVWPTRDAMIERLEANQIARAQGTCPVGAVLTEGPAIGTDLPALSQWISALSHEHVWENTLGSNSLSVSRSTRALLLRQRTKLPALLMRLKRHGIQPYVLAKEGFWDSPGVRLLMAALEAVAHPDRPLPCAVLLRHLAGFSDIELHQTGEFKGLDSLDIEKIPAEKRPNVTWLQGLKTAATQRLAASLLADGNLLAIITSLDAHGAMEPHRARRNLAGFLAMLQDLPACPRVAYSLLDELRNGAEKGDLPSSSQDADLIIQTVHGSKGLEYDDVILPLLNNKKQGVKRGRLLTNPENGALMFAWKLGVEPGKDYKKIAELVERQQHRDDLNLFYVAITRAKKRLCLLIQAPEDKKPGKKTSEKPNNSWAQLGKELLCRASNVLVIKDAPPIQPQGQFNRHGQEKPMIKTPPPGKPLTPTPPALQNEFEDHLENIRSRQDGEAMHAYLQNLLARWEDQAAFNHALNNPPTVSNAKNNALRFLEAIESRGWRHLRRRTEMNLQGASQSGGKGRADLVIWDKDCIHVIDLKHTTKLTPETEEIYKQQLNRYASAIGAQNAPIKAIKGWLALLKSGEWKELI